MPADVGPLFVAAGYRPELLAAAADDCRFHLTADATTGPLQFALQVRRQAEEITRAQRTLIHSLTPIQLAVLRVMAACGNNYAPFEAATMDRYRLAMQLAGVSPADIRADVPGVQQALIALQEKKLAWRAARGIYSVEERGITDDLIAEGLLAGLEAH